MDNPLSWDYLTTVPGTDEVFGPFAVVYLVVFGFGFLASVFLYNDGARRYTRHGLKRKVIKRGSAIAVGVFSVGLFFFGIRILQINPFTFGMRLWLWLCLLALVAMAAYFLYYLRTSYRVQLLDYEQRKIKAQYLRPIPGVASAAPSMARYEHRRVVRRKARR